MHAEHRFFLAVLLALACLAPAPARADGVEAGKRAYVEGERLFRLGRFADAIAAYERAFSLDARPAFLFNIALSHRRQFEIDADREHLVRARHLYRTYLQLEPASTKRSAVEQTIRELGDRLEASVTNVSPTAPTPEPPPTAAPATPMVAPTAPPPVAPAQVDARPPRPSPKRWYIVGGVIGGAVVVGGAIALGVLLSRPGPVSDGPPLLLDGKSRP